MSRFNYTSALGDNLSPFAPKKEYIATEALIGAGIGLASLGGSIYSQYQNLKSQADINETNYKIHQEDLAYQREAWKNSQLENRFLVNQAYERNLPKNVVKNLREAGINPALAFYNGSVGVEAAQTGTAPAPSSAPSSSPMVAPRYPDLGMGISDAYSLFLNSQKTETDMQYIHQKAQNETAETIAKVEQMGKNSKYLSSLIDSLRQEMLFNQDSWNYKLHNLHADFELKTAQSNLAKAEAQVQDTIRISNHLENAFRACTNDVRAKQMIAENALLAAQKVLAYSNANSISEMLPYQKNLMKSEFIHLMNQDAAEFEQIGINMEYLGLGKGHANMDYLSDWIDPLFKGLGTGAGIFFGMRTLGKGPVPIRGFGQ